MNDTAETRIVLLEANLRDLANAIARGDAGKIHAIKAWRAATGATLKDSKDYIEAVSVGAAQQKEESRLARAEDRIHYLERRVSSLESRSAFNGGSHD